MKPFRPVSTAMPAEFSPTTVIVAPELDVMSPVNGPEPATSMPNRSEPLANGPVVIPSLVVSPVVVSVTLITPSTVTLLLLFNRMATVPDVADVFGVTEAPELTVMSPSAEVEWVFVSAPVIVPARAWAAKTRGASAAATNRRFIPTTPLATGRPFRGGKCQLDVDTHAPRRWRQDDP